jgi:hypothetical protein
MARGVCQHQAVTAGSSKCDTRATACLLDPSAARTPRGGLGATAVTEIGVEVVVAQPWCGALPQSGEQEEDMRGQRDGAGADC